MSGHQYYTHSVDVFNNRFDGSVGRLDVVRTRITYYLELTEFLVERFGPGIPLDYSYIYTSLHRGETPRWAWRPDRVGGQGDTVYFKGQAELDAYTEFMTLFVLRYA